jgi:histidinol-phosphate phosphatase family protein
MKAWNIDASWTLFLDRDGVINQRKMGGYITSKEAFVFEEGVLDALKIIGDHFHYVFVVTNQQGIGKGIMTESDLIGIHDYMVDEIEKKGGKITHCYFAPELKNDSNSTRKPSSAMALRAKSEFEAIDFEKAIMVGDTDTDILFGKSLNMKTVRIHTVEPIKVEADITVNSLIELAHLIR